MKMFRVLAIVAVFSCIAASAAIADISPEEAVENARQALADKGIAVVDCNVVYDKWNKSWEEWGAYIARTPNDNNHGVLPHGVLENYQYQAVYFDFYNDAKKDVWVFVDLKTGNVLAIYEKK